MYVGVGVFCKGLSRNLWFFPSLNCACLLLPNCVAFYGPRFYQFFFFFKSNLNLMKMQTSFWFEKNSDLHLMKMQVCFYFEKNLRSASKEDADLFLFWGKFKYASNKDADLFLFWEKFRFASNVDSFLFWEKELITCKFLKLRKRSQQ